MADYYLEKTKKTESLITKTNTSGASTPSIKAEVEENHMGTDVSNQKKENAWKLESGLDVLMLLLYSEGASGKIGEPIEGITRLDKIMYLLSQTVEFSQIVKANYEFQADNFGPFAPELFDDIQALKQECIIEPSTDRKTKSKMETVDEESVEGVLDEETTTNISYPLETYKLTEIGMKIAAQLYANLSIPQKEELKRIKKTFGTMSLKNLLYYVYSTAPSKMLEKSKIKEDVLGK